MTKIVFAVLAAFALQVAGGAAFAAQDVLKADNVISNPVASCCGAGKDKKDKDSKKDSKSVVSVSGFQPACGGSCDGKKKDEKQEPKAVMACGGSCDSKKKDEKQEPRSAFLS